MNAINFIKQYGVDKARDVVEGAPEKATAFNIVSGSIIYYQLCDNWWWYNPLKKEWEMGYSKSMRINLSDLKCLVESMDMLKRFGGIELSKEWVLEYSSFPYRAELEQAIADYESIYGGEHV